MIGRTEHSMHTINNKLYGHTIHDVSTYVYKWQTKVVWDPQLLFK